MLRFGSRNRRERTHTLATALPFALNAPLLAFFAVYALWTPHTQTIRWRLLGNALILLALICSAICVALIVTDRRHRRMLSPLVRPGEQIAGVFGAELVDLSENGQPVGTKRILLTLTNQRLLLHRPGRDSEPWLELEHEEIATVKGGKPVMCSGLRRCVLHTLRLTDDRELHVRMSAGTASDFVVPSDRYLVTVTDLREMRALVVAAKGPTPSRPELPLDAILAGGNPTLCLLSLNENYLQVGGEDLSPLSDLHHYFHWEHMTIGELKPAGMEGLPESWRSLTLCFHQRATMKLCGTSRAMRRLRQTALSRGASKLHVVGGD